MKKFNYFLAIAVALLFSSFELNAFTTTNIKNLNVEHIDTPIAFLLNETNAVYESDNANFQFNELKLTAANSSNLIHNNLKILYSICLALVLFNLVAQVKIIVQMIQLFFLFRQKDDAVELNF